MHTDRLARDLEWLEQALDLSRESRRQFLRRQDYDTGLDRCLRTTRPEVTNTPGFLQWLVPPHQPPEDPTPLDWIGRRLGAYRISGLIEQGGMGTVFRAERADEEFTREVAIKIATTRLVRNAIARFTAERQLLARLEHPSIARLYDGGTTPEGVPYLVMELVEGEPIDRYCDRHRLSIDARLRLLVEVLSAVEHAHHHLIVHCDLKPQNILVTKDRRVKLLDFGIATVLEPSCQGRPSSHNPMTPGFASPEQMVGAPTTTSSDIYSMGIVAYELLTGQSPYLARPSAPAMLRKEVLTEELRSPSQCLDSLASTRLEDVAKRRSTSTPSLRRCIRGDLDAIVQKALEKHPAARYTSAESFAADVVRHLERRPVRARSSNWTYRTQRLIERHATIVSILLIAFLAIAGMSVAFAISIDRTSRQKGLVENQRLQSQEASEVVVDLVRRVDAKSFTTDRLSNLILSRGLERVSTRSGHPSVQSATLHSLAAILLELGRFQEAAELSEQATRLRQGLYGKVSLEAAESENLAATVYQEQARFAEAEELFRRVLSTRTRLLGTKHPDTAMARNNLGLLLWRRGKLVDAEEQLQRALEISREELGDLHPGVLAALGNLALVQQQKGDFHSAEILDRQALQLARNLFGEDHLRFAVASNNLAMVLLHRHRLDEAETLVRNSLRVRRNLLGEQHPASARAMHNLGIVLIEKERFEEAEGLLEDALAIRKLVLGTDHPDVARSSWQLHRAHRLGSKATEEPPSQEGGSLANETTQI